MPDLHEWIMTPWHCVCGRRHAPWWRSTPPPSCPHGWPDVPSKALGPPSLDHLFRIFGSPLPLPGVKEARDA